MKKYSFENKNILITGASGGLGAAITKRLAKQGAHLVLSARSDQALKELISTLPDSTVATAVTADLSVPGQAKILAKKAIAAAGHIDVLINNAGIGYFALMQEATEENIRHLFEVNTFSPLALIAGLLQQMKKRADARIINIVSCAGRVPIPAVGVYGGSKSALAVMTNTMRLELEPAGIDIINIYPGTIDTSFEENALREEKRPGLCPRDTCGIPRFDIADKVLNAASGSAGEQWLEPRGKRMSIAAIAWPKYIDRRLAPIRDRVVKTKSTKKRTWRLIQVESSLACNLRCIMCPWRQISKEARNHGIMSYAVWEAIKPHLEQVKSVDFTGGGEPLLQPHLLEWVAEAHAAGCETGILTNGLLLKEETAQGLIRAGIDWICVSMDGATADMYEQIRIGSNFERVCENLGRISRIRSANTPKTMINFVLMPMNFHQVEDMVRLTSDLGVDQVNFKQCDVIRGEQGKGYGLFDTKETREIRRLKKDLAKARRLAKKLKIKTTAFSFTPLERPVCDQDPRDSVFVRYDGSVAPCINLAFGGPTTFLGKDVNMPTVHYGRLPDDKLIDLWQGADCRFYRDQFAQRQKTHDDTMLKGFIGGVSSNRQKTLEDALRAMPEAPEGCRVCHYLYDI